MSLLTLRTTPELGARITDYYRRERVLEESGADRTYLLVDDADPGTIVVVAHWGTDEGYSTWQNAPVRARFTEEIAALTGGEIAADTSELTVVHVC